MIMWAEWFATESPFRDFTSSQCADGFPAIYIIIILCRRSRGADVAENASNAGHVESAKMHNENAMALLCSSLYRACIHYCTFSHRGYP